MNIQIDDSKSFRMENNKSHFGGSAIFFDPNDDGLQNSTIGNFREFIRASVPKDSLTIEIGPSYSPILPRSAGYNVRIVDHADQAALRIKYKEFSDSVRESIEEVDYVWTNGLLSNLISENNFSAIVAAHVIEHFPDLVGFIKDCENILDHEGRLFLIVPDKRFCFDYFQPASDVAKILGDHFFRPSSRHSFETHYRTTMHVVAELKSGITLAWGQENVTSFEFLKPGPLVGDPKKIYDYAFEVVRSADYKDNHNNFFTPATFLIIIEELRYLGLINFQVDTVTRPRGCEFLVIMRRARLGPPPLTKFLEKKKMLLMQAMREEKERLDFGPIL